ncbi:SDR family NAD(P)-dependent oxidoreductase [Pseudonocardia nigra]|uniref:SDR family NAD(P)-dependent oxidoreductase n=1 Tax=Pseudonocardia nigra TaxID=1921578 RepID=UPI0027E315B9|nr:SDR family oxidoreductase [Pseudonocardia nigra]
MTPRVALVTGCGKGDGMGQAIAHRLAAAGHAVVVTDLAPTGVLNVRQERAGVPERHRWDGLDALVAEIRAAGGSAEAVLGDIADPVDAERMVAAAPAYLASKAGVIGLTRSLAMDVAAWGITVNAICPGLVGTSRAILDPDPDPDLDPDATLAARGRAIPVGRVGLPTDIAAAVQYLAGEDAGYVTAQTLVLDGGGLTPFPLPRPAEGAAHG